MSTIRLVCPNDPALLARLEKRTLCVRVKSPDEIAAAVDAARARNALSCVICDLDVPLDRIEVNEAWQGVPIVLMAPSVGRFCDLSGKLNALRTLDLRVYLPYGEENLTGARMLASVGIPAGIVVTPADAPDWDAVADLMTYALLGVVPHAPIEPFQTMASGYRPNARSPNWGRVWFDDPSHYLHIDEAGRIALSRAELLAGDFIADDLSELESPAVRVAIEERVEGWRDFFLGNHFCARCKGWGLCHGRFCDGKPAPDGCQEFFHEMAGVIEQARSKTAKRPVERWQP